MLSEFFFSVKYGSTGKNARLEYGREIRTCDLRANISQCATHSDSEISNICYFIFVFYIFTLNQWGK